MQLRVKILFRFAASGAALLAAGTVTPSVQAADFYRGKQVEFTIGGAPGGGYDRYGRTFAKHIGKYITGNPSMVPRNRPGAGGRKAVSWIVAKAPRDGRVFGIVFPGAIVDPVINPKRSRYDPRKLTYIGSANRETRMCLARKDSGVTKFEQTFSKTVILGASQRGGSTVDYAKVLNLVLGTKFKVIQGYKGSKAIVLSIERGETQGLCGYSWESLKLQKPNWAAGKEVTVLTQIKLTPNPEITKLGAPLIWKFVKNKKDREVLEFLIKQQEFGRPLIAPPAVPGDRVKILRGAFDKVVKDAGFLKDAKRARIAIDPISGAQVAKLVGELYNAPREAIDTIIKATATKKKKKKKKM
jgi:tripartite-type tricarboxylate transporter receptor subunit TctC